MLRVMAERHPDRPFVKCAGRDFTFSELNESSDRVAAGLARLGVATGDRVALLIPNRAEMPELFFGCAKAVAIQVPLNCCLKGTFLRYQPVDSAARFLVGDADGVAAAAEVLAESAVQPGVGT